MMPGALSPRVARRAVRTTTVSVLEGLRRANPVMDVRYAGVRSRRARTRWGIAEAAALARDVDAIVLALGEGAERTGEAESRARRSSSRSCSYRPAQRVTRASHGKPLVAVLMNGRPLAIPWIADSVPAIVEGWYLGTEHGEAMSDVLFGEYSPGEASPFRSRVPGARCRCISGT